MQSSKRRVLTLALAAGLLGTFAVTDTSIGQRVAYADTEKVEARQSADVFASPGEQSRVVTRVRAGKEMEVISRKNRWIKVRVNGRTGWITRSNVRSVELAEPAPRAKRQRPFVEGRSTSRGKRSKPPRDRVGADATEEGFVEDDEEDRDSRSKRERERAAAKRKAAQKREMADSDDDEDEEEADEEEGGGDDDEEEADGGEEDGGEEMVESEDESSNDDEKDEDEREVVVVSASKAVLYEEPDSDSDSIESASTGTKLFVVERDGDWIKVESETGETGWVRASKVDDPDAGYKRAKWTKSAHAGLGYASIGQSFRSNGADIRSNYDIASGAAVIALGGEMLYDYSKKYMLGGELGYRLQYASPGIQYTDPDTNDSVNIGFKTHQIDLGALGGYKFGGKRGMVAFGRLGYHYERFGINNVEQFDSNVARLPSEILSGPSLGAIFDVPRLTEKFAVRARLDMMPLLASRKQTAGLEDGASSAQFAMWFNAAVAYDWKSGFDITGAYEYAYAKTTWTGAADGSMRLTEATSATRTDATHTFMVGIARGF